MKMKETNNIELIKNLIGFIHGDDDVIYHTEIVKRRKDHPNLSMKKDSVSLGHYYIKSLDQYERVTEEIKNICDVTGARAYINLNAKSIESIGRFFSKEVAELSSTDSYKKMMSIYPSCVGKQTVKKGYNKMWLIDCDGINVIQDRELVNHLITLRPIGEDKVIEYIPTPNGYHLITKPFDLGRFDIDFLKMDDVKKNSPTLLYSPILKK
ncbi:hypothetical protein BPT24_270 [Tenacibaculum phage pT24]|uniref:Uncharacterized protein n=1 Tax=Tenacibaculum phage pT24 TaxID=1880590 RepID=A0A1B4XX55_9CAUD|nr:hypothetical protein HYP10_gp258 [Tenacibaculum phage pT24]BAV39387.1 hypothetical protein BPT24_270 [Tenacibaculum phage pT24]